MYTVHLLRTIKKSTWPISFVGVRFSQCREERASKGRERDFSGAELGWMPNGDV